MAVRDERDERSEPDQLRQPRVSADREVDLSRPVEGVVADGPPPLRPSPVPAVHAIPAAPSLVTPMSFPTPIQHHHHHTTAIGMRVLLVTGVAFAIVVPIALQHPEAPDLPDAGLSALLAGMAVLKAVATFIACVAVMWRLKRHTSAAQRVAYLGGPWFMALGVGLIVSVTLPFAGALVYDVGLLLLLAVAASDERLRRGRSTR